MTPSTPLLSAQLRQTIYYHLDNDLLSNALFFAGRLQGLDPRNPDAVHLLALCHRRLGQYKTAYDYSRVLALRGSHLGCTYVFALTCYDLERYVDGVAALERARPLWENKNDWNKHSETSRKHLPDAAAVYCLLGKLLHANRDVKRAIECYVEALKLNPFMWDAFERLCDTGTNIRTANIFKLTPEMTAIMASAPLNSGHGHEEAQSGTGIQQQSQHDNVQTGNVVETDPFTAPRIAINQTNSGESINAQYRSAISRPAFATDPTATSAAISIGVETPPASGSQETTFASRIPNNAGQISNIEPPNAPMRRPRTVQATGIELNLDSSKSKLLSAGNKGKTGSDEAELLESAGGGPAVQHKRTVSGNVSTTQIPTNTSIPSASAANNSDLNIRRSRRLFNQIRPNSVKPPPTASVAATKEVPEPKKVKATGTRGRSSASTTVGRVVSGNRKPGEGVEPAVREPRSQSTNPEPRAASQSLQPEGHSHNRELETTSWVLELLGKLGRGYFALSQYQCQLALQCFQSVPAQQRDTPWVLAQVGKAYYEQNNYLDAEKTFARIKKMVPSRVEDMEIYSTVLWHLKNDTELAFLSHELIDVDRLSSQAWCTIGNSFSLQREHDHALKCFRRATQLNPKFAYGFTLQGHEHIANEEYDKAMAAYRKAITADSRHYNGWYGLGKVYEKLGKYDMAEKHYKAAASINPTNPVLVCCIGVILEKMKRPQAALVQYNHACELQPSSTLSRYKKARILLNLRRHQEALDELNVLKDLAPDESNVHYMLGRTHGRLRNKSYAIKHYTIAINLDPKAAPFLKEQMEGLDEEDDGVDDDDEEMT